VIRVIGWRNIALNLSQLNIGRRANQFANRVNVPAFAERAGAGPSE
jgi:hypothetical protein